MAAKGKKVPVSTVPEVASLIELGKELSQLKEDNAEVFAQYELLVERYNAALEVAEQAVRQLGVSCGPFDNFSASDKYNPDKMFEELGEDLFLQLGGSIEKKSVYGIDKAKLEAAIALGKIHPDSLSQFHTVTRNYHAPKKKAV